MHLLLVEDDMDLGASLAQTMRRCGFTVEWLRTAADAKVFAATGLHDCVLLDLSLPDGHGLVLLRAWRAGGLQVPLIVITASDLLGDRLAGLDEGADDFLVKPFAVEQLISRIHAVMRRAAHQAAPEWRFDNLTIDTRRRLCRLAGEPVPLTQREFEILLLLARAGGRVVPKHRLAQALDLMGDPVDFNAIEVHIHNLRRKDDAVAAKAVTLLAEAIVVGLPDEPQLHFLAQKKEGGHRTAAQRSPCSICSRCPKAAVPRSAAGACGASTPPADNAGRWRWSMTAL